MGCAAFLLRCGKVVDPDVPRPPPKTWDHPPGDFAPLALGYSWKYRMAEIRSNGAGGLETRYGIRTWLAWGMTVDSATGAPIYELFHKDSALGMGEEGVSTGVDRFRAQGDSVIPFPDNHFADVRCQPLYKVHFIGTSNSPSMEDISRYQMFTRVLGPDTLRFIRQSVSNGGTGFGSAYDLLWGEGLGLIEQQYHNIGISRPAGERSSCVLVEFNGVPVPPLPLF